MKINNKYNLPETIVRATHKRNDNYDAGNVHRSVTQLIKPPQIDILRKLNYKNIESDVSGEFWSLLGTAVHYILEMGAASNMVVEERLFADVDGWRISGAIDVQEELNDGSIDIMDYKVTSVYSLTKDGGDNPEWERQQNILRYLVETVKGVPVNSLSIVAIIRDWQGSMAKSDPLYPVAPILRVRLPMWSMEETERYIKERISLHRQAEMMHELGLDLPECSAEERWERGGNWAVFKKGGKRASKVFSSEIEAKTFVSSLNDERFEYVFRPGTPSRCQGNYCQVAEWCGQRARELRRLSGTPVGEEAVVQGLDAERASDNSA